MTAVAGVAIAVALVCLAWGCYWKARFHEAKAEVYQQFADDFGSMQPVYRKPREERRREARKRWLNMMLADSRVRDGLYDALHRADEHWSRLSIDGERGAPQ